MVIRPEIRVSKISLTPKEKFAEVCNFNLRFKSFFEDGGAVYEDCRIVDVDNAVQGITVDFTTDVSSEIFDKMYPDNLIARYLKDWRESGVLKGRRTKYSHTMTGLDGEKASRAQSASATANRGRDLGLMKDVPKSIRKKIEAVDFDSFEFSHDFDKLYFIEKTALMSSEEQTGVLVASYLRAKRNDRDKISMRDALGVIDDYFHKEGDNDANYIQRLSERFIVEDPQESFDTLVLPAETKEKILVSLALSDVNRLDKFNAWGLSQVEHFPRAVLNFYGPPGTGKTHAAKAVAKHLGKPILIASISELKCKWIGESAKNIRAAFYAAQKHDAVLFFDEADGLVSQRSSESDTVSSESNSMRNEILVNLESHKGVVIFASNFVETYDSAMETRMQSVPFLAPDEIALQRIWETKLPQQLPGRAAIDSQELAKYCFAHGFCGRDVKNALINACKDALYKNRERVTQDDLKDACAELLAERKKLHSGNTLHENTLKIDSEEDDASQQPLRTIAAITKEVIENINNSYLAGVPCSRDFDYGAFVRATIGMSDREIYRIVHLACLNANLKGLTEISYGDIQRILPLINTGAIECQSMQETLKDAVNEVANHIRN